VSTAVVPVAAAAGEDSSSFLLALALGAALGLSLLVVAFALTPAWALPRSVLMLVYDKREALILLGFAAALSIAVAITFAVP
jgi:Flp pilus assembly protein TadB